jgi:hypothetical protein
MSKLLINEIKKITRAKQIKEDKKARSTDIIVYLENTKDRNRAFDDYIKFLKKEKTKHEVKKSSKSSLGVLNINGYEGDIIFKPLVRKGSGGEAFEEQLVNDLNAHFGGESLDKLQHSDTIADIKKEVKLRVSKGLEAKGLGKQNVKRTPAFNNGKFTVMNNGPGVPVDVKILRNGSTLYNISVKFTEAFYIYQGTVNEFFMNDGTKKSINEYFGFDGTQMGGFGPEYFVRTSKRNDTKVKNNLASLIKQGLGDTMLLVNKVSQGRNYVHFVKGKNHRVSISDLNDDSYIYPVKGQRKYAAVKVMGLVNGDRYKIEYQFRGTTPSDRGPRYLRINLKHA